MFGLCCTLHAVHFTTCSCLLLLHFVRLTTVMQRPQHGQGTPCAVAAQWILPAACEALLLLCLPEHAPLQPARRSWLLGCNLQSGSESGKDCRRKQAKQHAQLLVVLLCPHQAPALLPCLPSKPAPCTPRLYTDTSPTPPPTCVHGELARLAKAQARLPLPNAHFCGRHARRRLQRVVPVRLHEHCTCGRAGRGSEGYRHRPRQSWGDRASTVYACRHAAASRAQPHLQMFPG